MLSPNWLTWFPLKLTWPKKQEKQKCYKYQMNIFLKYLSFAVDASL